MGEKEYTINGKTYIQRPLVLGQARQLMEFLRGVPIPRAIDIPGIIFLLGDKTPQALAIVLIEEGKTLSERWGYRFADESPIPEWYANKEKMLEIVQDISGCLDFETTKKVIDDFFDFNPISSLFDIMTDLMETINEKMQAMQETGTSSRSSAFSSLEEISPSGTGSSGELPSRTP